MRVFCEQRAVVKITGGSYISNYFKNFTFTAVPPESAVTDLGRNLNRVNRTTLFHVQMGCISRSPSGRRFVLHALSGWQLGVEIFLFKNWEKKTQNKQTKKDMA